MAKRYRLIEIVSDVFSKRICDKTDREMILFRPIDCSKLRYFHTLDSNVFLKTTRTMKVTRNLFVKCDKFLSFKRFPSP